MNLKKLTFRFLLISLLFYFTLNVVKIARVRETLLTWLIVVFSVALLNLFTRNLIKFLTLKVNFLTMFVATILLTTLALYFLDLFIPGFDVKAGVIGPINLDVLIINSFEVNEITAKLFVGAVFAIIVSTMDALSSGAKDEE